MVLTHVMLPQLVPAPLFSEPYKLDMGVLDSGREWWEDF